MIVASEEHNFFDGQVCVFRPDIADPYNDWSQAQADQGFSYRDGSVAFLTTFEAGNCLVNVMVSDVSVEISRDASRVIEVPFVVSGTEGIQVASVIDGTGDELMAAVPEGIYSLRYEAFPERGEVEFASLQLINLHFIRSASPKFAILRADSAITIPRDFVTTGRPA